MSRQINWVEARFGVSPAATVFNAVSDVQHDLQGRSVQGKADADLFNTTNKLIGASPRFTVSSEDKNNEINVPIGTTGTFTCVHKSELNAAQTPEAGDIRYTLTNALCENHSGGGAHEAIGTLQSTITSRSTDGVTSPLTVSVET
ncbi:hypothetical protein AB1L88_15710 [Tautonia sp. JC769]|uniref:hypothetical protein n=1 Tax=Tautonia sp. JC769 TaxID=3232135 RepID=UPI003459F005